MRLIPTAALLLALAPRGLPAQIAITPAILTTTDQARSASYVVRNLTPAEQSVSVQLRFGYPVPDSTGEGMTMVYGGGLPLASASLSGWARAYPGAFRLRPGEAQTVRLLVQPPRRLAAGVYWTRVVTTSTPLPPAPGSGAADRTVRLEQVTTLLFKRGAGRGDVAIDDLRVQPDSAGLLVWARLRRTGSAPFLGTVTATVLGDGHRPLAATRLPLSVYTEAVADLRLPASELPPGEYAVRLVAAPGRDDVPADFLPGTPAARELTVRWEGPPGSRARGRHR